MKRFIKREKAINEVDDRRRGRGGGRAVWNGSKRAVDAAGEELPDEVQANRSREGHGRDDLCGGGGKGGGFAWGCPESSQPTLWCRTSAGNCVTSRHLPRLSPLLLTCHAERRTGEEPPGVLRDALTHPAAAGLAVQRNLPLRDRLGGLRDRSDLGL